MSLAYEFRGVRRSFGSHVVLDGLDLEIARGEMVAITGPSGSGKSTVMNLLGLLDAPESGQISVLGEPAPAPRSGAAYRLIRNHIGYLFQNFGLIDDTTVVKNLEVALAYARQAGPRRAAIADALAAVGLAGSERRGVHSLSGGEQQRVAVARLLLKPCDIVLADEPTGSLDADNRDVVLRLLHEMNESGKTVVLVTHDPVVVSACSRVVRLDASRVGAVPV